MNEITQIYSSHQKRVLPIKRRIMDVIYSTEEEVTVAEMVGILEIIKFELIMESDQDDGV